MNKIYELKRLLMRHGFKFVFDGDFGFMYTKCRECGGDNQSKTSNESDCLTVKHKPDCAIAEVLKPDPKDNRTLEQAIADAQTNGDWIELAQLETIRQLRDEQP